MFNSATWAAVPFHLWSAVLFVFGTMVGSFLNVCIHRMPRGESVVSPPSHCPYCNYSIPWYLNIPLVTWLWLRGRCAHCKAPISFRYFAVELLTGLTFLGTWLAFGRVHPLVALAYCILFAGFIAATFIDIEHFIIPDEITLGGVGVGFVLSVLAPELHGKATLRGGLEQSFLGIVAGAGILYLIVRGGKLAFGRKRLELAPDSKVIFGEQGLKLPDEEVPYEDLFYRESDFIELQAQSVQLGEQKVENVRVKLSQKRLEVGDEVLDPESIKEMEVVTDQITLPREAMGLGDVKFMAGIGAFVGWKGVLFSLLFSSVIGAAVGISMIALRKKEWSSRIPYGPYIALAAVLWIFSGPWFLKVFLDVGR
jgi:leader peptidase (prepilin peptidase) / N-methyltransferase